MARLTSIRIAGWKSIRDIEPKLELGSLNVLIGANGSGKSNFVSFFKMMKELASRHFHDYIGRSGGAGSVLHHGLKIDPRYRSGAGIRVRNRRISLLLLISPLLSPIFCIQRGSPWPSRHQLRRPPRDHVCVGAFT